MSGHLIALLFKVVLDHFKPKPVNKAGDEQPGLLVLFKDPGVVAP